MTTTFRLLRQTNGASRFAEVTVEVAGSGGPEVEVTAMVEDGYRREAALGARWGLSGSPLATKVTVTDVVVTEADTSVGDVYEATAHAVWQAVGVKHDVPYVGFSDAEMVTSWLNRMLGRRLDAVTVARFRHLRESDAQGLLHAWLFFDHAVPVRLHVSGEQLLLSKEEPNRSNVDESGSVRLGPARPPDMLSGFVGARLLDGAVILGDDDVPVCVGLVLRFDNGELTMGAIADEWVLAVDDSVPAWAAHYWAVQPFVGGGSP